MKAKKVFGRVLAAALSIMMLVSMIIGLSVSAAEEVVFTDGFAELTADQIAAINLEANRLTGTAEAVPDTGTKWFNAGNTNSDGYQTASGGITADGGVACLGESQYNSLVAMPFEAAPTTGIYQIDFSVLTNGSVFNVDVSGSLARMQSNTELNPAATRSTLLTVSGAGLIYMPPASKGVFNNTSTHYAGNIEGATGKWLDVSAIIDLTGKKLVTVVKQDGRVVAKQGTKNGGVALGTDITANGLKFIRFGQYNGANNGGVKFKNVSVKRLDANADIPFLGWGETFDLVKNTNASAGFQTDKVFGASSTWVSASGAFARGGFTFKASANPKDDITFVNDTEANRTYMKAAYNGTSKITQVNMNLVQASHPAVKGIAHITYSLKVEPNEDKKGSLQVLVMSGNDAAGVPATLDFTSTGNVYVNGDTDSAYSGTNQNLIGRYDTAKWVDVDQYVDIPNKKWYVAVRQDGGVIAAGSDALVRNTLAANGIRALSIRPIASDGVAPSVCIDDVQAETVTSIPNDVFPILINGVKAADGARINFFNELTGDKQIAEIVTTANKMNASGKKLNCTIAYFDENDKLLYADSVSKNVTDSSADIYKFAFDPAEKPEDAASFKVFLWDDKLTPYCVHYKL